MTIKFKKRWIRTFAIFFSHFVIATPLLGEGFNLICLILSITMFGGFLTVIFLVFLN